MFTGDSQSLALLAAEILGDPQGLGFGGMLRTQDQVDALNAPGRTMQRLPVKDLDILTVSTLIDTAEFDALHVFDQRWLWGMLEHPEALSNQKAVDKFEKLFGPSAVDADGNPTEWPNGIRGATITAISALRNYSGSRAEEIFGQGTKIGRKDIVEALAHASRQAQGAG